MNEHFCGTEASPTPRLLYITGDKSAREEEKEDRSRVEVLQITGYKNRAMNREEFMESMEGVS